MIKEIKEADSIIDEMNGATYEKAELLRTKLEKCTSSFSNVRVDGSLKFHSREDALLLLASTTALLDDSQERLKEIYKRIENRDVRIYFDKVYFHMSNADLIIKYNLTKQQINRIVKKVKKIHQCSPDVPPRC